MGELIASTLTPHGIAEAARAAARARFAHLAEHGGGGVDLAPGRADPDNPPMTDAELNRLRPAAELAPGLDALDARAVGPAAIDRGTRANDLIDGAARRGNSGGGTMATNRDGASTAGRMLASKSVSSRSEKTVAGSALAQSSKVAKVSAALSSASKAVGAFGKPNAK